MKETEYLKYIMEDETIDDLQCNDLMLIQKKSGFRFGIDAILLVNFVKAGKNDRILDIGTGTGIIPVLLLAKSKARSITGIDIQGHLIEMANRSAELNGINDRVHFMYMDVADSIEFFEEGTFDVITTNPPYMKKGGGIINTSSSMAISKHEITCTLEDILRNSAKLLKNKGRFYMVHKPERLTDILYYMRIYKMEPKILRFVQPYEDQRPNLVLVGGVKNANPGLITEKPLYVYKSKLEYSDEINMIYKRGIYSNE